MRDPLLILGIHLCEILHVREEYLNLDDPLKGGACFGEDC